MSDVSPEEMRDFLERRQARRQEKRRALHEQAARDADAIIAMIRERYDPARIVQWGSVLAPERFREYSDIDIAVEGLLDPEQFFSVIEEAEDLTSFPVDIVQLERIEPEYRELILQKGRVVYER
jgi:predicted nucleotidyltransferase